MKETNRRVFEKQVLRSVVYSYLSKNCFPNANDIFKTMQKFYKSVEWGFSYQEYEFNVEILVHKNFNGVCLFLPETKNAGECSRMYAFFNTINKQYTVITVEQKEESNSSLPFDDVTVADYSIVKWKYPEGAKNCGDDPLTLSSEKALVFSLLN